MTDAARDQAAMAITEDVLDALHEAPQFRRIMDGMDHAQRVAIGASVFRRVRARLVEHRMPLYADIVPLLPIVPEAS
jgi:hypothetical protein